MAQWLGRRISDQGVPGSNPGWCTFRCGLEQVTFTLLRLGLDLVFRPDNMDETVPHTFVTRLLSNSFNNSIFIAISYAFRWIIEISR